MFGFRQIQGVFWHSTLLSTASCSGDPLGRPISDDLITDVIEVAVTVSAGKTATVKTYVNNKLLSTNYAVAGLNAWEIPGLAVGHVKVVVSDSAGKVLSQGTGDIAVQADATLCNYNPQVVALN